ncbi:DUF3806 domain-containing protein [Cellulomonas sp. URHE0023]|uniref:DUF3806 domain-containing protein n=1 Tax=Cellulomonas sp. URHE0023 TaxID=1380354 RepID=UPI000485B219|nr:DUF3806 domain-containing protein [Cellulomonas sp. URHE0023]
MVDPARMTDARPTLPTSASGSVDIAPGIRTLLPAELGYLARARAHLAGAGIDVKDPAALGALLHRARTAWASAPPAAPPTALVLALGVGVGDLLIARVPGARWALHTGSADPTPTVVSASGLDAALPLTDVRARWMTGCTPEWVGEYVASAAAHLVVGGVPGTSVPPTPAAADLDAVPHPRRGADDLPRSPAELPHPPSSAAQDIALGALERALDLVLTTPADMHPFGLVDGGSGPQVRGFGGDPAQAQQAARDWVRSSGAARGAVAWYGSLRTAETGDAPAVLVEASDAHRPSLVVAHRFAPATPAGQGRARPARPLGEPIILGQGDALL